MTKNSKHRQSQRYNTGAIILHWIMALAFFLMLASGIVMTYIDIGQSLKFQMYQWHKSLGVLLLLALGLRIIWRFISTAPALPDHFSALEKIAGHAGHLALYVFMILMPLSGWVMVSSSVYGLPTIVFDMFEWPHIPDIQGNEVIETRSRNAHFVFAVLFSIIIFTHIAAVIKHMLYDNENLLNRMWWR
ncbi:MAG: cytochrome b [Pseudomonadota bacterium]